jgi:hypothetical protein
MEKKDLLDTLKQQVNDNIKQAQALLMRETDVLSQSPASGAWSVLQIVEHLNTYNNYYVPKIEALIVKGVYSSSITYKPGMLGNYFVKMMQPVNGAVTKKYKAAKQHLPKSITDKTVIEIYIKGQQQLSDLIDRSIAADLIKNKVPISISPLIKLRLGDVYRFLIAHQQRHFVQIDATLKKLTVSQQYH